MANRIFRRKIYDQIKLWKEENDGKSALLIEGARRVGKSTIVEQFAQNEYESYILIDFNKCPQNIRALFNDMDDLDYVFMILQQHYRKTLANSLNGFGGLDKARWAARLEALGFAPNVRAEALTRSDFLCIFRDLQSQG